MSERYQVVDGSQSAHCCFAATVVDTHKPIIIGDDVTDEYDPVCECMERGDADKIAAALNATVKS